MSPSDAPRTSVRRLARPAFWISAVAMLTCAFGAAWSLADTPAPNATPIKRVFHFNANANAIGGTITRIRKVQPPRVPLFTQASSSLAAVGGISVADQGRYRYRDIDDPSGQRIISYDDAHTRTVGEELPDGCHQTTVMSVVNGFNVLDRLTADALEVTLVMKRCPNDDRDADIRVENCKVENLKIDGVPIHTECDPELMKERKLRAFLVEHSAKTGQKLATESSLLQLSLLKKVGEKELPLLESQNKHAKRGLHFRLLDDNGIYVPDFGKVYVGRFFAGPNKREISMLHLALGSPVDGLLDAGAVVANGCYFP